MILKIRFLFAIGALSVLIPSSPATTSAHEQAAAASLQDALEYGHHGNPAPYTLHMNAAGSGIAGYVYTPFVRVAMASRAAYLQQRELDASELPGWLTEPVTYIAIRWYCVANDCELPTQPIAVRLLLQPRPVLPARVSTDFRLLARFGADRPSPDTVVIAAFPVSRLTPGTMVEACVWEDETHCNGRGGMITERDVASWK